MGSLQCSCIPSSFFFPFLPYSSLFFSSLLFTSTHLTTVTFVQGIDAIRDVIYHLETFDTTTIRASTPMFLMSRKIKVSGTKEWIMRMQDTCVEWTTAANSSCSLILSPIAAHPYLCLPFIN